MWQGSRVARRWLTSCNLVSTLRLHTWQCKKALVAMLGSAVSSGPGFEGPSGSEGCTPLVDVSSPWVTGTMSALLTTAGTHVTVSSEYRAVSPIATDYARGVGYTEDGKVGQGNVGGRVTGTAMQPSVGGCRVVAAGHVAHPRHRSLGPEKCRHSADRWPGCLGVGVEGMGVAVDGGGLVTVGARVGGILAVEVVVTDGGAEHDDTEVVVVAVGAWVVGGSTASGLVLRVPVPAALRGCTGFVAA